MAITMDNNTILPRIAEELDITETQKENIVNAYDAVGEYLDRDGSSIHKFKPQIYPQGSMALGTIVKPVGRDDCDVDMVCYLSNLDSRDAQPSFVKNSVGNELKQHGTYSKMLDKEGKRCWTLNYSDSANFHMDILPSTKPTNRMRYNNTDEQYIIDPISATNKDSSNGRYCYIETNPKGYVKWFQDRMIPGKTIDERKKAYDSLEKIKSYKQKTPLQQSIQLLKRHRDVMFKDDEDKPISIIITTLSAYAYTGTMNVFETAQEVLTRMLDNLTKEDDKYILRNPACWDENFCDKWNEKPIKALKFFDWYKKACEDFITLATLENDNVKWMKCLSNAFDSRSVYPVLDNFGKEINTCMREEQLGIDKANGNLIKHSETPMEIHSNYGRKI